MGYCTKPGECICESGYFGFRCDHEGKFIRDVNRSRIFISHLAFFSIFFFLLFIVIDGGFIGEEHVSNSEQSVDSVEDSSEFLSAS